MMKKGETTTSALTSTYDPGNFCAICMDNACSNWEVGFNIRKGVSDDKSCFLQAVASGGSVRINMKALNSNELLTLTPVEYKNREDSEDIDFYFAPRFVLISSVWYKEYLGLSTNGHYHLTRYSMKNRREFASGTLQVSYATFFIRYAHCNSPSLSVYTNDGVNYEKDEKLANVFQYYFHKGCVPFVQFNDRNNLNGALWGNWLFSISTENEMAILKTKGDVFAKDNGAELDVRNPLERDFRIVETTGRNINLRVGHNPSFTQKITQQSAQIWYLDVCWTLAYKLSADGKEDENHSFNHFQNLLSNGQSVRVMFQSGWYKYFTWAHNIFCTISECKALLENHPELDSDALNDFQWKKGETVRILISQFNSNTLVYGDTKSSITSKEKTDLYWYVDSHLYNVVFRANYNERKYDAILQHLMASGAHLRMIIVDIAGTTSYHHIDHVVSLRADDVQLHTTHMTDIHFRPKNSVCPDKMPLIYTLVLLTKTAVLKRYTWSSGYRELCSEEQMPFIEIKVFAPGDAPS